MKSPTVASAAHTNSGFVSFCEYTMQATTWKKRKIVRFLLLSGSAAGRANSMAVAGQSCVLTRVAQIMTATRKHLPKYSPSKFVASHLHVAELPILLDRSRSLDISGCSWKGAALTNEAVCGR